LNYKKDPFFGKHAGDEGENDKRKPGNPYAGNADLSDIYLSPAKAEFRGFPPMLLQVGGWEMLLDDSRTVAKRAREAGVDVTLMEYPGMFHVFQAFMSCRKAGTPGRR
jgi:acetyl esterase/lipase